MTPANVDLVAYRGTPFIDTTDFVGQDYSAATFVLELRDYRDKPGSPRVALQNAAANAQGISCSVKTENGLTVSAVRIQINETTIEGLPFPTVRGSDLSLAYALDVAGGGHGKARRMQGRFTVEASANG